MVFIEGLQEQTQSQLKNMESHYNPAEPLAYDVLKFSASESTFSKFDLILERMLLESVEKTSSAVFILFKDEKEYNFHIDLILEENHPLYIEVYSTVFWERSKKWRTPDTRDIICIRQNVKHFTYY